MSTSCPDPADEARATQLREAFTHGIRAAYRVAWGDPDLARSFADGASAGAEDIAAEAGR